VLRVADTDRNGHLWYLALNGLRRGEIAGLTWSDIDFDAKTITIARSRVELGGGKGRGDRERAENKGVAAHPAAR
jgi:integrase